MIALLAFLLSPIAFVPLDDRPVTSELPPLLGRIAGRTILEPSRALLGKYLTAGSPEAIIAWLNTRTKAANDYVISADMLAYGGLIASRTPANRFEDAAFRLRELQTLRTRKPHAWIGVFGTVMRLAPTGVPASQGGFFAAYPAWLYLQEFANLHDPPSAGEAAEAERLRGLIGTPTLDKYLQTRERNYGIDAVLLQLTARSVIDTLVLGQDDAGPVGLHVKEVRALQSAAQAPTVQSRAAIEPGADELGMALIANALARGAGWTPHVAVRYSAASAGTFADPLEYAPVEIAIDALIRLSGGVRDDAAPDVMLYVREPGTTASQNDAFIAAMRNDEATGRSVAFADLTFLQNTYADQARFTELLLSTGTASRLDAYASWNTNANTVGTALAEAIAAGAGRRSRTYDELAHKEFTFERIVDDYAFHDYVRPMLNAVLDAQGITDHMLLTGEPAVALDQIDRAALWNRAAAVLPQLYPGYHIASMKISLPWSRTFETQIEAALAPDLWPTP